jgi:hypothetical protein
MRVAQNITLTVLILVTANIIGCASGPPFRPASPPPPDAALVYIYRLPGYNGWAGLVPNTTPYRISADGQHIVDLCNGGYYWFLARPGTNSLGSSMKYSHSWALMLVLNRKEILRTEFEPGETYYLKFEVGARGSKLAAVDPGLGQNEIKKCRLITDTYPSSGPAVSQPQIAPRGEAPPFVFVGGEFRNPGRYTWTNGMTLKEGMDAAGGLTDFATRPLRLTHWDGSVAQFRLGVGRILTNNPPLKPGDSIMSPRVPF